MHPKSKQAKEIFLNLVGKVPANQWDEHLQNACAGDEELEGRVRDLLRAHTKPGSFLEQPVVGIEDAAELPPITEGPGTLIGSYKLLEQIGEGGMGVVYRAEQQEPVKRTVALKVIKPGMDSRQVIARFEAERQALAMMDHPNIAKVLDAGTTEDRGEKGVRSLLCEAPEGPSRQKAPDPFFASTGRPYFVMDLVKGIPITEYCDRERLFTRERLDLFVAVCQAVQHAHQKGIIHRDIKPSNVLVTLHDGTPVPKIIDFGVAKATSGQLTDQSVVTGFAQVIGTPLYMSPEQAELGGQDIDTRTDIYSLGVLLYELLTGTTPFEQEKLSELSYDEMRRIIREEEPPKPSTRISTLDEALDTVAENRRTDRRTLTHQVRGELDWIAMKALDKDRTRRYESANSFARDVRRYLNDEPVEACPPSAAYRFRKFVRRNRARVVAIATVALSLVAMLIFGVIVFAIAFREEKALRQASQQSQQQAEQSQQRAEQSQQRAERSELEARRMAYASDIMLASRAWRDGDLRQFVELLDQQRPNGTEPDVRGFEWYYLRQLPQVRDFELTGHQGAVYFICRSPDGQWIATAGEDGTVRVYDVDTRQIRTTIETGQGDVNGVDFAPDGRTIASAGDDGTVHTWDLDTGQKVMRIAACPSELYNVLYTPDGKLLISCGDDPVIRLWDAHTGEPEGELSGHGRAVEAIALSPDGHLLASASSDETARLWDLDSRTPVRTLTGHRGRLSSIAFSPDGKWVATGCLDKTVGIWDPATGALVTLLHHLDGVQCLAFGPEGRWLAAGDRGGVIRLWPPTWALPDWSFGSENQVRWCGISPDGRTVVAATWERVLLRDLKTHTIRELELADPTILRSSIDSDPFDVFGFSSTGTMLACLTEIHCADPSSPTGWSLKTKLDEDYRNLASLAFSPDGRTLATGMKDGTISLWDTETGKRRSELEGHRDGWVSAVAYSPDGRRLASTGEDCRVVIWNTEGTQEAVFSHDASGSCVAFSPDGTLLASGDSFERIQLWNLETGRHLGTLVGHMSRVGSVAFSPDGSRLASAASPIREKTVRIWDVKSRRLLRTYSVEADIVAFLPDGTTVMSGGTGDGIRFWSLENDDTPQGQEAKTLKWHDGRVYSVASLPHTGRWVSAGQDGRVVVSNPASFSAEREVDHPADDAAFLLDGRELAIASPDGVHRVDTATGAVTETLPGDVADWGSVAAAPNGSLLAARNLRGTLCLWDVSTRPGRICRRVDDCPGPFGRDKLVFSPDGRLAVVIRGEGGDAVWLIRTDTGEVEHAFPANVPSAVAFSPDGAKLAFDVQNDLSVWDVSARRMMHSLRGHTSTIETISFSPDGRLIASAGKDRNVLLWDGDAGRLRFTLTGHRDDVLSVAFSPDGRSLATADKGGRVKLWQVATGRELSDIAREPNSICWVAFSPDGSRLAYLFDHRLGMRIIHVVDYGIGD